MIISLQRRRNVTKCVRGGGTSLNSGFGHKHIFAIHSEKWGATAHMPPLAPPGSYASALYRAGLKVKLMCRELCENNYLNFVRPNVKVPLESNLPGCSSVTVRSCPVSGWVKTYSRTSLLRTPFTTFSPMKRTNSKVPNFRNALYMLPVSFITTYSGAPLAPWNAPNSQRTRVAQNKLPSNSQRGAGTLTISRCIVLHVGIRSSPVIDLITLIHS